MSEVYFGVPKEWELWAGIGTQCTCGTTITMGKDDQPIFHSDYCQVRKDYDIKQKFLTKESK